jgi:fatty acid desaturase
VQRLSFPLHSTESARDGSYVVDEQKAHLHPEIFWLLAFGFWLLAFGFWLLAFGFWLLAFASCFVIFMFLCLLWCGKTLDTLTSLHHLSDFVENEGGQRNKAIYLFLGPPSAGEAKSMNTSR